MPHDENALRDKTSEILNAYLELTGYSGGIGISDFLLIRRQAEEELKFNLHPGTNSSPRTQNYEVAGKEEPVVTLTETTKSAPSVRHHEDNQQKPFHTAFDVVETTGSESEEDVSEQDDYTILRQMEDPWN